MFFFLRSILIIMFSCCRQSLDLDAETVSRYIYDTSHQIKNDVMSFQWHSRKKNRIDFQEFGLWYNEVGIMTAQWVELLDLKKWALVDECEDTSWDDSPHLSIGDPKLGKKSRTDTSDEFCPFQPSEEPFDESFFTNDGRGISLTDSMDDIDFMLMQQYSNNKENDEYIMNASLNPSPKIGRISSHDTIHFNLVSHEDHGGYKISISQRKVRHLRTILVESGLHDVDAELAAQRILGKASNDLRLTKEAFDSAITELIETHDKVDSVHHVLSELLTLVFNSFDRHNTGFVDAQELAIGFTVLCRGKKSDKLESSFEMLSTNKDGRLNKRQVSRSLRSFLTVLLCVTTSSILKSDPSQDIVHLMNGKECVMNSSSMNRAAHCAANWALSQVFNGCYASRPDENYLDFDDFGLWYTRKGHICISWLEWLDLRKPFNALNGLKTARYD